MVYNVNRGFACRTRSSTFRQEKILSSMCVILNWRQTSMDTNVTVDYGNIATLPECRVYMVSLSRSVFIQVCNLFCVASRLPFEASMREPLVRRARVMESFECADQTSSVGALLLCVIVYACKCMCPFIDWLVINFWTLTSYLAVSGFVFRRGWKIGYFWEKRDLNASLLTYEIWRFRITEGYIGDDHILCVHVYIIIILF